MPVALIPPLHTEPGLCLQLALKQLSPGVRVEPCISAVLQFSVDEIGQLVPLLPNPCTPISNTRWQTEDLDGNKVLFQVSAATSLILTCRYNCGHKVETHNMSYDEILFSFSGTVPQNLLIGTNVRFSFNLTLLQLSYPLYLWLCPLLL